jgi:tetratricopeptide (TPR) repeat protein
MKNICLSIFLGFYTISLFAQAPLIQNGLVREQNSGKRPVTDVQIIFLQAAPTTSDGAGKFRLAFAGKKAGDLAFMTEIAKKGYELVNDKELEHVKLSSTDQLGTDIIVAKTGVLDAAKKEYYAISDKALKAGFEKQKALLKGELAKAQLSEKQYQDQFEALQKQHENQKKELDNLAEKFAKVNFDDVSALYQEALQLFKDGKIDEAIKKLESVDLIGRTDKRLKERERIANENAINEKGVQEDIKSLKLQVDLYLLKFDIAKAEVLYDRMLLLDSTNLDILSDVADFYRENHRYEKALRLYPKIIEHPQAEAWQKANAYSFLGNLYTTTGNLNKAMEAYTKCYQTYSPLSKNAPDNTFYKNNLAVSYSKLGETHTSLGNLDKALGFYEEYNHLEKELYAAYPNNVDFKNGLAISYQFLGYMYTSLGNLDKALGFYEEMNKLSEELYAAYPNNMSFKNSLAVSYSKLGNTHTSLGNLDKALGFYEYYNLLKKELYAAYPNNVDFKNGLAISYEKLGQTHMSLGNLDKALGFYEDEVKLFKELYATNPNNVSFKNSLAISYSKLGETHTALGNLDKTLGFYEEDIKLSKELYAAYPNNVDFKNGLAISYEKLGSTHTELGNLDKALGFYEERNRLGKELYAAYPNNVDFKNGLAISCRYLGETHTSLGNLDKALGFYEYYNLLKKELYATSPNNVDFKNSLAISYYKLGAVSIDNLKDRVKARAYFKQAEALWLELVRDAPQYVRFKQLLGIVQEDLKSLD